MRGRPSRECRLSVARRHLGRLNAPAVLGGHCSTRGGFTLFELILVIGIVSLLMAMSWPAFDQMFAQRQIVDAATQLRTRLRETRRQSMADGIAYRCDYLVGSNRLRTVPDTDPFESTGSLESQALPAPSIAGASSEVTFEPTRSEIELPFGIRVITQEEFDKGPTSLENDSASAGSTEKAGAGSNGDFPLSAESTQTAGDQWMPIAVFYPDGSSVESYIRLVDESNRVLELSIRPLTGEVQIGDLEDWLTDEQRQQQELDEQESQGAVE